jgi:competence protein ComEC
MLANHKGEIPFVILLLPFLAGIFIGVNFASVKYLQLLIIGFSVLSVAFIGLCIGYNRFGLYKVKWLGGLLLNLVLLLAGWILVIGTNELNNADHFSKVKSEYLVVKINNEPVLKNGYIKFTANVEQQVINPKRTNTSGTLLISIKDSAAIRLNYGDELLIPANYNAVDPPFNPAEFNYKKYLAHQNIHYQEFLYPRQYVVLNTNAGNPIIAYALQQRKNLVQKLKANMVDTNAIAVASTLILGYKADLSEDILQAYSKTGTIHVLSVSGAHVAILYLLLNFLFSFLDGRAYGKLFKAILIITAIWNYALLTGFSPAVCRAVVMLSLIVIGKTYSRYINTLNILAISAFALLLYNPHYITDVGFQLSYLAVGGLVVFEPIFYKLIKVNNPWLDKVWKLCSISIAAQVITFPLSAYYFHQFPVYFLVSNLLITIPIMLIMYSGLMYLLLPQIPLLSKLLAYVLENSILFINKILAVIEKSPKANISKIWLNTWEYLLLYTVIICLFYFLFDKKMWLVKISLGCLLVLSIGTSFKKIDSVKNSSITFLNLRKHIGLVFKHGNQAVVVTDLPTDDNNYRYSIQPYLDSTSVNAVSYNLTQNINTSFLKKNNNLIQFRDTRILIYNPTMENVHLPKKLKVDYVYLTGNPHTDISAINKNFGYNLLVIDGSNSKKTIDDLTKHAQTQHISYRVLKRNRSLTI